MIACNNPLLFIFSDNCLCLQNLAILPDSRNDDGDSTIGLYTKLSSATAPRRSSFPFARRPRSRLGNPARLRRSGGGVGSPCLRLADLGALRSKLTLRNLRRSACVRLHPRPKNGETKFLQPPPAASRCSPALATLSVCLGQYRTDSGKTATLQTFLPILRRQPLAVVLRFARTRIY